MFKIVLLLFSLFSFQVLAGEIKEIYFTPSESCENLIIKKIKEAEKEINVIIYSFTNNNIFEAIKEAKEKGIKITVIADRLQSKNKSSKINELIDNNIEVIISNSVKIEHNKVLITDKINVINGSYNWTKNATYSNSENCIYFIDDEEKFYNRFQYLKEFYKRNLIK